MKKHYFLLCALCILPLGLNAQRTVEALNPLEIEMIRDPNTEPVIQTITHPSMLQRLYFYRGTGFFGASALAGMATLIHNFNFSEETIFVIAVPTAIIAAVAGFDLDNYLNQTDEDVKQ